MKDESNRFRHESLQDSRAIARYLTALADGIEKGTLQFRDQQGELTLEPNGMIRFAVNADRKSERNQLSIKLSWKQPSSRKRDTGPLTINDTTDDDASGASS
jgi:amphi-Trp domain-containing protein